ncbi:MAG: hypothetical protein ACYTBJ_22450, partial [Planctomycetota bacterium]
MSSSKKIINRSRTAKAALQRRLNQLAIQRRKSRVARGLPAGRRNLGPMGELGDDIIFSVDITGHYDRLVENGGTGVGRILRRKGLDTSSDVYRSIWGNVYFPLQQTATTQINTNAPKMTGKLRKAMKESIKVPLAGSFPLVMILNTAGVDYAKPVEKMPSTWLKHPT